MASVKRHANGREVVVLDNINLHEFVQLSPSIAAKRQQIGATAFSDLLRAILLAERGGTWIDATVLMTTGIDSVVADQPFFLFTRPDAKTYGFRLISSWFIHSAAGHPLACAMRDLLLAYWDRHNTVREYFMLHYLFEAAITLHADLRRDWNAMPMISADPCHHLLGTLQSGASFDSLQEIARRNPVNKLSYKLADPALAQAVRVVRWSLGQ